MVSASSSRGSQLSSPQAPAESWAAPVENGGIQSSSKSDLAMNVFIYVDTSKEVGDPARVPQKKRMRSFSSIERHLPLCSMPPILDKKDLAAAGS
jgi:hypothetical protein